MDGLAFNNMATFFLNLVIIKTMVLIRDIRIILNLLENSITLKIYFNDKFLRIFIIRDNFIYNKMY